MKIKQKKIKKTMNIFPWQGNELPYFVSEKDNKYWYIDKSLTDWCTREVPLAKLKPLKAIAFLVAEKRNGKLEPFSYVLMDIATNNIIHDDNSFEGMACKIDFFRAGLTFD